jgi:putative ABC transport system permease protein
MKYSALVLKNLTRNRRRVTLTALSIGASLFIYSGLSSLPSAARQILSRSDSSVRIVCHNEAGLEYPLPEAYKRKLAAMPHVEAVAAQTWFGGVYDKPSDQFPNLAVDPEKIEIIWPDWGMSKLAVADFKRLRTASLVGGATMKRFHWKVGQQIILRGTVYPVDVTLTIVGTLGDKGLPDLLVFRRDYLETMLNSPGRVNLFWVKVDRPESLPVAIAEIDQAFANSQAQTSSEAESAFLGCFLLGCRTLVRATQALGLIAILAIGLVAANTAVLSIRERRSEVAAMRSMGFSPALLQSLLVSESVLVGLAGGLIGCGAAFALFKLVGMPAIGFVGVIQMPPVVWLKALGAGATIGFLSAVIPARAAARLTIAEALRLVG